MRKLISLCLAILMTISVIPAQAATKSFTARGEQYTNSVEPDSKCAKSTDGDTYFYVTIKEVWSLHEDDRIYFGPRRAYDNGTYSGSLSSCLGYYLAKNPRQKAKYTKSAPGGVNYALNVKQTTAGPGNFFLLDVTWTP